MKRRRLLLILLASVASITLASFIWPREREPEYDGISLSTWLDRTRGRRYDDEFTQAVNHMGTNALPVLLRSVDYQMPPWKIWLRRKIAPRLPAVVMGSCPVQWLIDEKALRRADAATVAFGILGSRATPALDDLRRIASKHPMGFARAALSQITLNSPNYERSVNLN
jgi:hypothetical protein